MEMLLCGHDAQGPGVFSIKSVGPGQFIRQNWTGRGIRSIGAAGCAEHYTYLMWRSKGLPWRSIDRLGRFIMAMTAGTQQGVGGTLELYEMSAGAELAEPARVPFSAVIDQFRATLQTARDAVMGDEFPIRC